MKSVAQEARDCLEELIPMLERDLTPQPDHWCGGPDASCDGICVDNALISDLLIRVRRVQGKLDNIIKASHAWRDNSELEFPGQKVDAYARTPATEMPNY